MSCNKGSFEKEKLIDLVEERPELWKVNLKMNRQANEKSRMWEEVAARFDDNTNAAHCAKVWKNLYDSWVREHTYWITFKSGSGQKTKKKWCWYERMSFLKNCGKDFGPTDSNVTEESISESNLPPKGDVMELPYLHVEEDLFGMTCEDVANVADQAIGNENSPRVIVIRNTPTQHSDNQPPFNDSAQKVAQNIQIKTPKNEIKAPINQAKTSTHHTETDELQQHRQDLIKNAQEEAKRLREEDKAKVARKRKAGEIVEGSLDKSLGDALVSLAREEDSDTHFLKSFTPSLQKLNSEEKGKVKLAVSKIFLMADLKMFDNPIFNL